LHKRANTCHASSRAVNTPHPCPGIRNLKQCEINRIFIGERKQNIGLLRALRHLSQLCAGTTLLPQTAAFATGDGTSRDVKFRNVMLQVTYTKRSYYLNFHPVPHGVTVSCERYTMGFPVCYGSQQHHECKEDERSGLW
jgi:hypothetical protein